MAEATPKEAEQPAENDAAPDADAKAEEAPSPPTSPFPKTEMEEFIPGQVWIKLYYVRFKGVTMSARTTIVKLSNGSLWVHSPGGPLDEEYKAAIEKIGGKVAFLIAPGDFHHLKIPEWQLVYPEAKTFICPGLETKRPDLRQDGLLKDEAEDEWKADFEQMVIHGRMMSEVLFLHKPSSTLIVTDLVEFVTDQATEKDGTKSSWGTWFYVSVLRMRNRPVPAPEYRIMGFPDKEGVKTKLQTVIDAWKPEKVIMGHGELMVQGNESISVMLSNCWSAVLGCARKPSIKPAEAPPTPAEAPPPPAEAPPPPADSESNQA